MSVRRLVSCTGPIHSPLPDSQSQLPLYYCKTLVFSYAYSLIHPISSMLCSLCSLVTVHIILSDGVLFSVMWCGVVCSPGLLEELSQSSEPLSQCLSVDAGQSS